MIHGIPGFSNLILSYAKSLEKSESLNRDSMDNIIRSVIEENEELGRAFEMLLNQIIRIHESELNTAKEILLKKAEENEMLLLKLQCQENSIDIESTPNNRFIIEEQQEEEEVFSFTELSTTLEQNETKKLKNEIFRLKEENKQYLALGISWKKKCLELRKMIENQKSKNVSVFSST